MHTEYDKRVERQKEKRREAEKNMDCAVGETNEKAEETAKTMCGDVTLFYVTLLFYFSFLPAREKNIAEVK